MIRGGGAQQPPPPAQARAGEAAARLREALQEADYTPAGVAGLLGPAAGAALERGETVPAERVTRGGGPLVTLVRLFLLQRPVPEAGARAVLPLQHLRAAGLVAVRGGEVRARLDLRPYDGDTGEVPDGGWWVVSDLPTGLDGATRPLRRDHVLGVGGAARTLAGLSVPVEGGRALDVGTGCGVQALHLGARGAAVTATDVLPRALGMARLTTALSGLGEGLDLREGSLLDPVAGERFGLVVSNPPFVVTPGGAPDPRAYRDSGLPGDEVCRRLLAEAPAHLEPGGWFQMLANWEHRRGEGWAERVAGWLPAGCDAWVVQREVLDPAAYVAMWLRDSGETGRRGWLRSYDASLVAFEAAGVEAVGLGWVSVRASGTDAPVRRVEEWPHAVAQPLGATVEAWGRSAGWLREHDDAALLRARLLVAADVAQEQVGRPGAEDPEHVVLRQALGMRRAERADTVTAALVGACEGTLGVGAILDAVAALLGEDPGVLRAGAPSVVRRLVGEGFLQPPQGDVPAARNIAATVAS